MDKAIFAAGCFWGVEDRFRRLDGVADAVSGYTGGHKGNPTYEEVCTGKTGHAEGVQVTFDPERISFNDLLKAFFSLHDPTQVDRQGPDVGSQYRSAIFYLDETQKKEAEIFKAGLEGSGLLKKKVATQILPASTFWKAEEYHQKYFEKNGGGPCSL